MRLLGNTLQFALVFFALHTLGEILPQCALNIFSWVASIFTRFCLTLWILEFTQDYFFNAKVEAIGRAVLITGCDTGFGNAIAKILDKRGFRVFASCYDKLSEGACNLKETCSSRLKVIQLDVTKDESVQEAVKSVESNLEKSDLWAIVNNAGILKGFQTELSSMTDYEDCIQVNAIGVIRVTKAFLPLLRKSKGRVVNICSMAGRFYCPNLGAYSISKHAAVAFTGILRQELIEFGMRVISIEPEFFKTPLSSEQNVRNVFDQSLAEVHEEIKSAYGSSYINKAKRVYLTIFSNYSPDVKRVLDAIEDAVSLRNPADIYRPCRNILVTTMFFMGERVSTIFIQIFVMITQKIMGLPKPETGMNYASRLLNM